MNVVKKHSFLLIKNIYIALAHKAYSMKNYVSRHTTVTYMEKRIMRKNQPLAAVVVIFQCSTTALLNTAFAACDWVNHQFDKRRFRIYFGGSLSRKSPSKF